MLLSQLLFANTLIFAGSSSGIFGVLISFLIHTCAVMLAAFFLPGIEIKSIGQGFLISFILGLTNTFIRPLLLVISFPINLITLGLFIFVIDAAILIFIAQLIPALRIRSFGWAILFGIVITIMNWILTGVFGLMSL